MAEEGSERSLMERLTDKEFRELMPHLKIEELISIQIKTKDKWDYLFHHSRKKDRIKSLLCSACNIFVPFDTFQSHLNLETHMRALNEVDQFYQPIYTYAKCSDKLAKGEKVTKAVFKDGIYKAIAEVDHQVKFMKAKRITSKLLYNMDPNKFEKTLESLVLKTDVKVPEHIFADVFLPLMDLLTLEFCLEGNKWSPMLTTNKPQTNSKYYCALCLKYCAGIKTVNAHLNGFSHKRLQLGTLGVRVPTHSHLTKNCSYQYDEKEYSLIIRKEGRKFFNDEAWKIISFNKTEDFNEVATSEDATSAKDNMEENASVNTTILENYNTNINEKVIKIKDNYSDIGYSAINSNKLSASENIKPKLSKDLASKAKALAAVADCYIESEGLIGVEYVVKIKKPNDPKPSYECCLCECDFGVFEGRMQGHLISYPHRLKYLEIHYPDTIKKYNKDIGHLKYETFKRVMSPVLAKLALEIEKHHGRSLPYSVSEPIFVKQRPEIVAELYNLNHACQQHGPSFSNVVSSEDIQIFKKNNNLYKPPVVPENQRNRFIKTPTDKIYLNQKSNCPNNNVEKPKSLNVRYNNKERYTRSRSKSFTRSRSQSFTRSRSPQRLDVLQRPVKGNDIWKVYREKISIAASKVECLYVEYRKNPESHPSYDQEWNRFWKRRKEELVSQGIDHRSYNYQPEWVRFFRNRLEQLFGEELHKSKINVRRRLNIPLDAEEDSQPAATTSFNRSSPPELKKITYLQQYPIDNFSLQNEPSNKRLRIESFDFKKQNLDFQLSAIADDKPNIIHVLRLMTALENHLGSLGSKIMDLLSNTLVLEKKCTKNPKDLEQRILTANNCTLLETAMEKLKGILYAGLLDGNKVEGFKKVIQSTADLLKHADNMGWRNDFPEEYSEKSNNANNDLQKLIEVMQNNKKADVPLLSQKSLSDTLKELITFQNRDSSERSLINRPKHDVRSIDNTQCNNSRYIGSSLMDSPSTTNDRFKQINPYPPTLLGVNDVESGSINKIGLKNFNTRLNRISSFGGEAGVGRYISQDVTRGRNNYDNIYVNKNKTNANAVDIGNMESSRNESIFQNKMSSCIPQNNNFSQLPNLARSNNFQQNTVGANDNWDRFQNTRQWSFNSQSQYKNN